MADQKEPAPSSPLPQGAPFEMASPFPEQQRPSRRRSVTVWTIVGAIAAGALQWFLTSHGVPAPVVDEAARQLQHAIPN